MIRRLYTTPANRCFSIKNKLIQKNIAIIRNHFHLDLAKQVDYCKTFVKNLAEKKKGLSRDARAERFENSLAGQRESL